MKSFVLRLMAIALLSILCSKALYATAVLSTANYSAGTVYQNTSSNLLYACKMVVSGSNATVNNIQFTLSGTHTSTELTTVSVYFNLNPDLTGASYLGNSVANFSAPKTYSININRTVNAGSSGYFIITFNVRDTAKDNKTIQINGATNPVTFGFTTATSVTNNQTNAAGIQTIQAADITLSSATIVADTLFQNSTSNIISATRMKVSTSSAIVNKVTFTLSGSHDANDLTGAYVYYNPTQVSISGAAYLGYLIPNVNATATYSLNVYRQMNIKDSGYYIISVNVRDTASDNKTVRIIAGTNPVVFGFTTKPNVTNNQTSAAGLQTIQAADITLSSATIVADTLFQNSTSNIISATRMKVSTSSAIVNKVTFTLSGSHDANDLTAATVYYNPTQVSLSGAYYLGYVVPNVNGPATYSVNVYRPMNIKDSGYYIITVNVRDTASDNKTVRVIAGTNPVVFGFTTKPNVTNNQTSAAGSQTIQAADITLTSNTVAAGNIARGSTNNIVYILKAVVSTSNVIANNIQFTLSGTHDADDLSYANVYSNSSPTLTGASYLGYATTNFAGPKQYSVNIYSSLTAGTTRYFMIVVNVTAAATIGNTVKINGATDPVVLKYTTAPNITNSQTNAAGVKTININTPPSFNTNNNSDGQTVSIVAAYPNPVINELHIKTTENLTIFVTNREGLILSEKQINRNGIIDMSNYKPGIYFIKDKKTGFSLSIMKE